MDNVERSIREQFSSLGLDRYGEFVGWRSFEVRAVSKFSGSNKDRVCQAVRSIRRTGFKALLKAAKQNFVRPRPPVQSFDNWLVERYGSYILPGMSQEMQTTLANTIIAAIPQCYSGSDMALVPKKIKKYVNQGGVPRPLVNTDNPSSASHQASAPPSAPVVPPQVSQAPASVPPQNVPPQAPSYNAASDHQFSQSVPVRNPRVEELLQHFSEAGANTPEAADTFFIPDLESQQDLLGLNQLTLALDSDLAETEVKNAAILSTKALLSYPHLFKQYATMGTTIPPDNTEDCRIFLNTAQPWSAFICGLQGTGKSHSLNTLLENCLIRSDLLGVLKRPLSGIVFHFGQYTGRSSFQPCEAAFLSSPGTKYSSDHRVPVTVLVSPSNFHALHASYTQIPGVVVKKLLFRHEDLNVSSMLTLMAVNESAQIPLYMAQVIQTLREMAQTSADFNYCEFKKRLDAVQLMPLQRNPLNQRLALLESFLDLSESETDRLTFSEGTLTIVDLSCPFVDPSLACCLFNICLNLFLSSTSRSLNASIIAVDEAHKYIGADTPGAKVLTESLITVIRQQRHFGARVVISTQEPTIDTRLMDLSSMILIHRFTSPEWYKTLKSHISLPEEENKDDLFLKIGRLRVGEGLLFCSSAVVEKEEEWFDEGSESGLKSLGHELMKIKVRERVTWDGGRSILAV